MKYPRGNFEPTKHPREFQTHEMPEKKFWTHKIPPRKDFGPTKYPREKNIGPMKYPREDISDPQRHHCTRPIRHTMAQDPWNLANSSNSYYSSMVLRYNYTFVLSI